MTAQVARAPGHLFEALLPAKPCLIYFACSSGRGKRVAVRGTIHSRTREGRIVEEFELLDLATMYQQLGLVRDSGS